MDRTLTIILASLVFASSAFLLPPAQGQVGDTYTLSGQVCIQQPWDEGCYDSLPDASIHIQGGGLAGVGKTDETLTSDEDGWFSKSGLVAGDYTLTINREGFQEHVVEVSLDGDEHVEAPLQGDRVSIAGRLVDAKGDGVAGAYIRAYGYEYADAKSAADGGFTLEVPSGWYDFDIEAPGHAFAGQRLLLDGSDVELVLGALPGQDAVIKGRVTDQHGEPVVGADVIIEQWEVYDDGEYRHGNFRNWTQTDDEGRYEVDVYGGSASISFRKEGHAQHYDWFEIKSGGQKVLDVELVRYPEKTARISGHVMDGDGKALKHYSISIQLPEYGLHECSIQERYQQERGAPEAMPAESMYYEPYYDPYYESCAITIHEDGSFSGTVTPGYGIVQVWYDRWSSCDETHHADGSFERSCGPDYFQMVQTLTLEGDADNDLDIELRQKPGPDAAISGYVVDGETQTALSDVWVSFSNQENYAYGSAETDSDGSYKVRLRSGYHEVSVYAEGFLPWQGMVFVAAGGETPFDIVLTPGESQGYWGGCCYAYAEDDVAVDYAESSGGRASAGASAPASSETAPAADGGMADSDGESYEDLGGGLGPYDPAARAKTLREGSQVDDGAIPSPLGVALVALAAVALLLRRR